MSFLKHCLVRAATALERRHLEPKHDRCTEWQYVCWGIQTCNCLEITPNCKSDLDTNTVSMLYILGQEPRLFNGCLFLIPPPVPPGLSYPCLPSHRVTGDSWETPMEGPVFREYNLSIRGKK